MNCWRKLIPWVIPALIALVALAAFGTWRIENDLTHRTNNLLGAGGVDAGAISVHFKGQNGTLRGPAASRDRALAAVGLVGGDASKVRYISTDGDGAAPVASTVAAPPATTAAPATTVATTAAPATTVPATTVASAAKATIDAVGTVTGGKIVLSGFVASEAQQTSVGDAARTAFGAGNVDDQLKVQTAANLGASDLGSKQFAAAISLFGTNLSKGRAEITDTKLTVSGDGFSAESVGRLGTGVSALSSGTLVASADVKAPAGPTLAQLQVDLVDLLGRSGVNFETGSATIRADAVPLLDTAAESINRLPGVAVEISGHTDNRGAAAANQRLSEQRAEAVRQYLVGKGVADGQLTSIGFGATKPIADNATEAGQAQNRRIEFKVQGS